MIILFLPFGLLLLLVAALVMGVCGSLLRAIGITRACAAVGLGVFGVVGLGRLAFLPQLDGLTVLCPVSAFLCALVLRFCK